MFIRPELGGKGTGCLFQFTYCETGTLANSEDLVEMTHNVAFQQGLHCLL